MIDPAPQDTKTFREEIAVFYLERLMDQLDRQCFLLAHRTFVRHRADFLLILDERLVDDLQKRVQSEVPNHHLSAAQTIEKVAHAVQFGEYRSAYDYGTEYILAHNRPDTSNGQLATIQTIRNLLAGACWHFLEPDDMQLNTFVNAEIGFVVGPRGVSAKTGQPLEGNPGFIWVDAVGQRYRCFVKQVPPVQVGTCLRLKVTNITNTFINTPQGKERVVYLEPRVESGDHITVEIDSLSHTGNSFTFRLHSYDGFLWFKRRGVNRELFNVSTLRRGDRVLAKVLYTTEEVKFNSKGTPQRLGLLKAIPVKRLDDSAKPGLSIDAATTPS